MMIEIEKCSRVSGALKAPPSKSMAHRLLICALLAEGKSTIRNLAMSEDILATIGCIKALGAETSLTAEEGGDTYTITVSRTAGSDSRSAQITGIPELNCRESGSTIRFFIPVVLSLSGSAVFTGSRRLFERSVSVYEELATEKGFSITKSPCGISASGSLKGGVYTVPGGVSSQFISGLLFALPLAEEDSVIKITPPLESASYIGLTVKALYDFGIKTEKQNELTYLIKGGQKYRARDISVEGDYSNAAFFEAFNYIGGDVSLTGLSESSLQGDKVFRDIFKKLKAEETDPISIADCPDLGPILFALSAALYGGRFTDTRRLKIKESDRADAMKAELEKFGCPVTVGENDVIIGTPGKKTPLSKPRLALDGHNDHRIAMSLAVLASVTGGVINGAEAVSKSMPDFFKRLESLGLEIKYV